MQKIELINYLDSFLQINEFKDNSKNWLQVDNTKKEINKIGYSVDASTYIFDKAKEEKIDFIICHHGMFWWIENTLTWVVYNRTQKLINNDIALYACHLPLDAHEEVWNNIWLLKWFTNIFWLKEGDYTINKFWLYHWKEIGYSLYFWNNKIHISSLQTLYSETLQLNKKLYNFWNKDFINSIAFISWWWGEGIKEAKNLWIDLFLTWEAQHHEIILAKELWQSIMLAWHYETEKIWPKLLTHHLKEKFWIEVIFLDEKY